MSDTCVPNRIVISTAINQLETKVSLKTICCLRPFVCFLQTFNALESKVVVENSCTLSLVVIGTTAELGIMSGLYNMQLGRER